MWWTVTLVFMVSSGTAGTLPMLDRNKNWTLTIPDCSHTSVSGSCLGVEMQTGSSATVRCCKVHDNVTYHPDMIDIYDHVHFEDNKTSCHLCITAHMKKLYTCSEYCCSSWTSNKRCLAVGPTFTRCSQSTKVLYSMGDHVMLSENNTDIRATDSHGNRLKVLFKPDRVPTCHCTYYNFRNRTTIITASATDDKGFTAKCRFHILVVDNTSQQQEQNEQSRENSIVPQIIAVPIVAVVMVVTVFVIMKRQRLRQRMAATNAQTFNRVVYVMENDQIADPPEIREVSLPSYCEIMTETPPPAYTEVMRMSREHKT